MHMGFRGRCNGCWPVFIRAVNAPNRVKIGSLASGHTPPSQLPEELQVLRGWCATAEWWHVIAVLTVPGGNSSSMFSRFDAASCCATVSSCHRGSRHSSIRGVCRCGHAQAAHSLVHPVSDNTTQNRCAQLVDAPPSPAEVCGNVCNSESVLQFAR